MVVVIKKGGGDHRVGTGGGHSSSCFIYIVCAKINISRIYKKTTYLELDMHRISSHQPLISSLSSSPLIMFIVVVVVDHCIRKIDFVPRVSWDAPGMP